MNTALIDANGVVQNIIVASEGYTPPVEFIAVATDVAGIGWTYSNGTFFAPAEASAPAPTVTQQLAALQQGVQHWLDTTAQANGYDGIASCCSYYNSTVAQYAADAKAAITWRDAVWQACYVQSAALSSQPSPTVPTLATLLLSLPQPATYGWTAHAPGA